MQQEDATSEISSSDEYDENNFIEIKETKMDRIKSFLSSIRYQFRSLLKNQNSSISFYDFESGVYGEFEEIKPKLKWYHF